MDKNPSPNGCYQFKIKAHKIEFWHVLNVLSPEILAIVDLLVAVSLSCVLTSGQGIESILEQVSNTIVLLLYGGDKSSQTRDIERAKTYWLEYKEAHL